jgi:membrane protein
MQPATRLQPQPETREPRLHDPGLFELSRHDFIAIVKRAGRSAMADQITDSAAALAYYTFLAIPATLLVALGVFGLVASPSDVANLMDHLRGTVPSEAIKLVRDALTRITKSGGGNLTAVAIGFVLALWTLTGSMNALMRAVNSAYGRRETRGFIRQRLTALAMIACLVLAAALVIGFLVLGPVLSGAVGSALGMQSAIGWIWWTVQWPILLLGLLTAFAAIYVLAPDVEHARFNILAPGTVLAVVIWLVASAGFSVYVATFASYNKTWGSLAAVIVLMTWLWLSALALLLGAEINAEAERSRELRSGLPAEDDLQIPTATGKAPETGTRTPAAAHANGAHPLRAPAVAMTGVLALALWALRGSRESGSTRSPV